MKCPRCLWSTIAAAAIALSTATWASSGTLPTAGVEPGIQDEEQQELAQLLAEERVEADRLLRRGDTREALSILKEHLAEDPQDHASRALFAACQMELGNRQRAERELRRVLAEHADGGADRPTRVEARRLLGELLLELGRDAEALEELSGAPAELDPSTRARDAWLLGRAYLRNGQRDLARDHFVGGARLDGGDDWRSWLARARCERILGRLEDASRSLVKADRVSLKTEGRSEPDVLVELGEVYFEADGEVADKRALARSPAELYREALTTHDTHEGALLGLFELHRYNWRRSSRSSGSILAELLAARPRSVRGLLAALSSDLDDGRLVSARGRIAELEGLAPGRRELQIERAALQWIEHRREECLAMLAGLLETDPGDSAPEREVGRHLLELYRFAEARPFLERSVERDPEDYRAWTHLARALANAGDEEGGREALAKAKEKAAGRMDAWRENTALVLRKLDELYTLHESEELDFAMMPNAEAVLSTYVVPHYQEAREDLSRRYGFTPGPVRIEIFRDHADFSVRSTGYEGFPATGVCFGPVVTAVSPLSQLRGQFSWARTSFHEFTHVIHLGLSHNRCPRWITEGLATYEEVRRNPAWTRNMRRELLDARANGEVIPVRDLNRAFRGPRILFGYYQGGLLCQMLIEQHGFSPMIRLLSAFDRGLDLDQAFREVFDSTPEEVDRSFSRFVDAELVALKLEPRWNDGAVSRKRLGLSRTPPKSGARRAWVDDWCTLAWSAWQHGRRVDAEEALRVLERAGERPPRSLFLRAEIALSREDGERAQELYRQAFEAGGEDFRARIALGEIAWQEGETEQAEEQFQAAEAAFPGFSDEPLSAELRLAALYESLDRRSEAVEAIRRWLGYNAGDFGRRIEAADWLVEQGRLEEAIELYREANEVDPFVRSLHRKWGEAALGLGRAEEAERELRVALLVPPDLELRQPATLSDEERAELLGLRAAALVLLEQHEQARRLAEEALALDGDCEQAAGVLESLP